MDTSDIRKGLKMMMDGQPFTVTQRLPYTPVPASASRWKRPSARWNRKPPSVPAMPRAAARLSVAPIRAPPPIRPAGPPPRARVPRSARRAIHAPHWGVRISARRGRAPSRHASRNRTLPRRTRKRRRSAVPSRDGVPRVRRRRRESAVSAMSPPKARIPAAPQPRSTATCASPMAAPRRRRASSSGSIWARRAADPIPTHLFPMASRSRRPSAFRPSRRRCRHRRHRNVRASGAATVR